MTRLVLRLAALAAVLALVVAACSPAGGGLTGKVWQWNASTITGAETVADPASYTVEFMNDGNFAAKADCNQVAGSYTSTGSAIEIVPGPSTLAMCPEGSLGDVFVAGLGSATTWAVANGTLTLTGSEGAMTFK